MKQKRDTIRLLNIDMRIVPKACHYAREALSHKRPDDIRMRNIFSKLMSDVKTELMQINANDKLRGENSE